jgi:hypothetical protein
MYQYVTKHATVDTMDIGLYIDGDNLYVINYLCYDYMYGHSEVGRKFSIEKDKLQHVDINKEETALITKHVGDSCASYNVMDHECKYYTVSQAYDTYRNPNEPFAQSSIQLKSKQSSFMAGKLTKSAHNKPTIREFTIHDATHVTQVIIRGEYTGLGCVSGRKADVYPAFVADSVGQVHLTSLRPDTRLAFTYWNICELYYDAETSQFPAELVELIASYC